MQTRIAGSANHSGRSREARVSSAVRDAVGATLHTARPTYFRSLGLALLMTSGWLCQASPAAQIIDFEDTPLPSGTARTATAADQSPYVSLGVRFNRSWNTEYDCCPSGWAVSNQTDQVTPGVDTAYSARVQSTRGGGFHSRQFAVGNNLLRGEARVEFPHPARVDGMYVTNVTYTYLATVEGNDGAGFVKGRFTNGDWLRLDVIGLDEQLGETGRVPIYLVDYRDGQSSALAEWTWMDLRALGNSVSSLEFEMSSTDVGPFGMNTPAFFAIDDLQFAAVPEPLSLFPAVTGSLAMLAARRRARSRRRG